MDRGPGRGEDVPGCAWDTQAVECEADENRQKPWGAELMLLPGGQSSSNKKKEIQNNF